jgi:LysM repeat protein
MPLRRLMSSFLRSWPTLVAFVTPTATPDVGPTPTPAVSLEAPPTPPVPTTVIPSSLSALPTETPQPTPLVTVTETVTPEGVPMPTATPGAVRTLEDGKYTVQENDTLLDIAHAFGVTMEDIIAANNLRNPHRLQVGQVLIIPTPRVTMTLTLTPTPATTVISSPTVGLTPGTALPYVAPVLLAPATESVINGGAGAQIELTWQAVGSLAADEWYAVSVNYESEGRPQTTGAAVKGTSWRVPRSLYGLADPPQRLYRWNVTVVRIDTGGKTEAISPPSATWTFRWP